MLKNGSRGYIAGFDGLRAIAALAVIGFHLNVLGLSLGWAGVNVFFALSGFLITSILLDTKGQEAYFRTFYWRRALRIFPIYYLGLGALIVWTIIHARQPITDWPWYTFYLQNWRLAQTQFSPLFPVAFDHTWSLASEEQFYLLWPAVIYWSRRKALVVIVVGLILLGPASRALVILTTDNAAAVLAPLPCIADMIAWGALAQIIVREFSKTTALAGIARSVSISLGVIIVAMAFHRGLGSSWHHGFLLDLWVGVLFFGLWGPLSAAMLIVIYSGSALSRALELPILRYLGRISYGLYFYHFPILMLVGPKLVSLGLGTPTSSIVILLLTVATSIISFQLIERPFLRMKDRPVQWIESQKIKLANLRP